MSQKLIREDDFKTPELNSFWELDRLPPNGYEWVDAPGRLGEKAIRLTVHSRDFLRYGPAVGQMRERCEIAEKSDFYIPIGSEVSYQFSFYIPEDFLVLDNRLVIAQWRTNKTTEKRENPPFSLRYINGELRFVVKNEDEWIIIFTQPDIEKGMWHDFQINYQWRSDHSGYCEVALDNENKGRYEGHFGYNHLKPEMHFRIGLYRDHLEQPQSLLFGRFKRAYVSL